MAPSNHRKFGKSQEERPVPVAEPGELLRGARPERFRILRGVVDPPANDRVDDVHERLLGWLSQDSTATGPLSSLTRPRESTRAWKRP